MIATFEGGPKDGTWRRTGHLPDPRIQFHGSSFGRSVTHDYVAAYVLPGLLAHYVYVEQRTTKRAP